MNDNQDNIPNLALKIQKKELQDSITHNDQKLSMNSIYAIEPYWSKSKNALKEKIAKTEIYKTQIGYVDEEHQVPDIEQSEPQQIQELSRNEEQQVPNIEQPEPQQIQELSRNDEQQVPNIEQPEPKTQQAVKNQTRQVPDIDEPESPQIQEFVENENLEIPNIQYPRAEPQNDLLEYEDFQELDDFLDGRNQQPLEQPDFINPENNPEVFNGDEFQNNFDEADIMADIEGESLEGASIESVIGLLAPAGL